VSGSAEQELRDLVAERVAAVAAKDPDPLVARFATDVTTFDLLPPLMRRGSGPIIEKMQQWFDGYASRIGYEVEELEVTVEGDLGVCSFAYHVSGTLQSGDEVDMWVRATLCCRRIDGTWKIVHDHESVPFDPSTGMAVLDATP
jgi:uncharacterized protein (TIGR02246 family)